MFSVLLMCAFFRNRSVGNSLPAAEYGYGNHRGGIPGNPGMMMQPSGGPRMGMPVGVDQYVDQYQHHNMYGNSFANAEFIPVGMCSNKHTLCIHVQLHRKIENQCQFIQWCWLFVS